MSPSPFTLFRSAQALFITVLIYIPPLTLIYRMIANAEDLPRNLAVACRILFTTYERKVPLAIYTTPGLIPALLLRIVPVPALVGFFRTLEYIFKLRYRPMNFADKHFLLLFLSYWTVRCLLALLVTIVFAPLDVMITRLVIQRNYGGLPLERDPEPDLLETVAQPVVPEGELVETETETDTGNKGNTPVQVVLPPKPEAIVLLRSPADEYLGVRDCFQKMKKEEGWGVFYRMAWLTFVGNLCVIFM